MRRCILRSRGCIFRRNGKTRKCRVAKRRDEESVEVGPTREAARISGPFDETPNVPLFAQQWRSNTGSCPFRHSRRYFTYLRWGTRDWRIRPLSCDFGRLPENIIARRESGFDKDIRELTDFFSRPLLNLVDVHVHRVKHRFYVRWVYEIAKLHPEKGFFKSKKCFCAIRLKKKNFLCERYFFNLNIIFWN